MNNKLTASEREHIKKVKELNCSLCDALGPSEAHHIRQSLQCCVVALCTTCHRDPVLGWHGQRVEWKVRKMDEMDALNITISRLKG